MLKSQLLSMVIPATLLTWIGPVYGQTYDPRPLMAPAAMPSDSLPDGAAEFIAWLDSSALSLDSDELFAIREHVYAIVSADAKRRFRETGAALPIGGDSALAGVFDRADRLAVPGAALVSTALRLPGGAPERHEISPGVTIMFDSLYTLVAQSDGWMVRFPHYFMIGTASRQLAGNGIETTTVMLSTLFAEDGAGASQATILLVSAAAPAPTLTAEWLQRLGLQPTDTSEAPIPSALRAYRAEDSDSGMVRELVVLAAPDRTILAIFAGLAGTAETNRPHFVNLLETLRIRQ